MAKLGSKKLPADINLMRVGVKRGIAGAKDLAGGMKKLPGKIKDVLLGHANIKKAWYTNPATGVTAKLRGNVNKQRNVPGLNAPTWTDYGNKRPK